MRGTRRIGLGIAAVAAMLALALPGAAAAIPYNVNTTLDLPPDKSCALPDECTLREAVSLAGVNDVVNVPAGHYQLTQPAGELFLTSDTIVGSNPRQTIIDGVKNSRVLWVTDGTARVSGVTITGGNGFGRTTSAAGGPNVVGPGGGIYVQSGSLNLENVAVVDNATTSSGGGVATAGLLGASGSTFARNRAASGGGILVTNGDTVSLLNSTVSGNVAEGVRSALGGGIASVGSLSLENTTIAANQVLVAGAPSAAGGGGIYQGTGQVATSVTILDSVVAANTGRACAASTQAVIDAFGGNHNLDDDGTCGFSAVGDKPGVNPELLPLTNNGGPTDTQGLSAGSPAISGGDGANCRSADQRGFARPAGACDIGAFEYYPPTQTPPTLQQELPPPVAGKTVNALPKSGRVRIKLRGSNRFVRLSEGQQVPVGTIFDTRNGHVTLVAASNRQGGTATAEFWAGLFRLGQNKKARPTTTLTLNEQLRCPKAGNATIAAKRKKKRRLWGDGSGKFRTKGKHSAATVVGTKWLVEDRCTSTLTRVVRGRVSVRDFEAKKTVVVRRGKRYIARTG